MAPLVSQERFPFSANGALHRSPGARSRVRGRRAEQPSHRGSVPWAGRSETALNPSKGSEATTGTTALSEARLPKPPSSFPAARPSNSRCRSVSCRPGLRRHQAFSPVQRNFLRRTILYPDRQRFAWGPRL